MRPVLLITGATSSIGAAVARRMAATHDIALATRTREGDARTLAASLPCHATVHGAALGEPGAAAALVARVVGAMGRLDAMALVHGTVAPRDPLDADLSATAREIAVNLIAPMELVAAGARHMRPGSAVVAVSSVNAEAAPPGAAGFAASKAGLEGAVRALARDHAGQGIRVNAVQPGAVRRDRHPHPPEVVAAFTAQTWLGGIAEPDDVAGPIAFLLSDDARWITGEVLRVAGGFRR